MAKPRTRSFLRGFIAGLITKFLTAVLLIAGSVIFDRIWAAVNDTLFTPLIGPPVLGTSLWWTVQALGFLAAIAAGIAAAHWSPRGSWAASIALILLMLVLGLMGIPQTESILYILLCVLSAPVGIFIGAALYRRREAVAQVSNV